MNLVVFGVVVAILFAVAGLFLWWLWSDHADPLKTDDKNSKEGGAPEKAVNDDYNKKVKDVFVELERMKTEAKVSKDAHDKELADSAKLLETERIDAANVKTTMDLELESVRLEKEKAVHVAEKLLAEEQEAAEKLREELAEEKSARMEAGQRSGEALKKLTTVEKEKDEAVAAKEKAEEALAEAQKAAAQPTV